ncbi:MAG: DUF4350 domain-containing protein [Beutenbergiaceae bacterium]
MSAPAITAYGERLGKDSTPTQDRRWRRGWLGLAAAGLALIVVALLLVALRPAVSSTTLAPDNPEDDGGRAAAQVLGQQGVEVVYVRTTAAALAAAEPNSTLFIVNPASLNQEQGEALAQVPADIVLTELEANTTNYLTDRIEANTYEPRGPVDVDCADEDALAAQRIEAGGALIVGDDVTSCFSTPDGALYVSWTEGEQKWRVLSDGYMFSNAGLDERGNAALVFRALGAHDKLIWYLPSLDDPFGTDAERVEPLPVPAVAIWFIILLGILTTAWRARRLGPVVTEPLPVVVKATETTRGRGRLYRRARAHAHAGAALRAGFLARVSGRLGLPGHAEPAQVVDTMVRISGRDPTAINDVLYGAPPHDDATLIALTKALDTLESEVQHP